MKQITAVTKHGTGTATVSDRHIEMTVEALKRYAANIKIGKEKEDE